MAKEKQGWAGSLPSEPPAEPARPQAQLLFQAPPKLSTAEADAALLFQQASLKSTAEGDPFFSHWHLRWAAEPAPAASVAAAAAAAQPSGEAAAGAPALPAWHPSQTPNVAVPALDSWDGLYLESTVDWPLQLLFPPEVRLHRRSSQ